MNDEEKINLYATDDLLTRAEKLVLLMGIRGSAGDHVLTVFKALQMYEKLDRIAKINENIARTNETKEIDAPRA